MYQKIILIGVGLAVVIAVVFLLLSQKPASPVTAYPCGDGKCDKGEEKSCPQDCNADNVPYSFYAVHYI